MRRPEVEVVGVYSLSLLVEVEDVDVVEVERLLD